MRLGPAVTRVGTPATPGVTGVPSSLYARWTRIGGLFSETPTEAAVWPEPLIADTCRFARDDARLFGVAASWLVVHGDLADARELANEVRALNGDERAIAGALFDAAAERAGQRIEMTPSRAARRLCRPRRSAAPLFRSYERYPALDPVPAGCRVTCHCALGLVVRRDAVEIRCWQGRATPPDDHFGRSDTVKRCVMTLPPSRRS